MFCTVFWPRKGLHSIDQTQAFIFVYIRPDSSLTFMKKYISKVTFNSLFLTHFYNIVLSSVQTLSYNHREFPLTFHLALSYLTLEPPWKFWRYLWQGNHIHIQLLVCSILEAQPLSLWLNSLAFAGRCQKKCYFLQADTANLAS